MKKKIIIISFLGLILLGITLCVIDYKHIKAGEMPIFMIRITDGGKSTHQYIGLGYRLQRKVGVSYKEALYNDTNIRFGLWFYTWKIDINNPIIEYTFTIEATLTKKCDNKAKVYFKETNKTIYTYCLDNIFINDGTKKVELKEYLESNKNIIEKIVNTLVKQEIYKDGGSILYKDNGNLGFTNNGLTILKCKTLEGNNDIYIGSKDMKYEEGFCKNK